MNMIADGMSDTWGHSSITPRPSRIICPQLALGSLTDRLRKASEPSATMATAMATSANATTGKITFGRISRTMILVFFAPMTRAAVTNSRSA